MSPQSGLPQNNRVGDFDPFALPVMMQETGKIAGRVLDELAKQSGLLGLSGVSGDVRDIEEAAAQGNARAELALDVFVASMRHYLGAYLVELGGADVIVFTGGIGENSAASAAASAGTWSGLGIGSMPAATSRPRARPASRPTTAAWKPGWCRRTKS